MTKQRVIETETIAYLANVQISSIQDIFKIEEELLEIINSKFDEHNVICAKDEKWKKPDSLCFSQIALILTKVFTFKLVHCSNDDTREYDLLGLYVDDMVIHFVPGIAHLKGIYITKDDVFRELARLFNFSITTKEMSELLVLLKDKVQQVERCIDPDLIPVGNGIFNYSTKKLIPFSPDLVFMCKSRINYNDKATNVHIYNPDDGTDWDAESWMQSLAPGDPDVCNSLWEITGAVLRPNVPWNKSAWLYSETGNNGKGTLCEMYRAILGEGAYASISLENFSKDFVLEPLINSSAIIVDENDVGTYIDKAGNLKSVITNDVIQINRKFKTPIAYQFRGFMVQCLNEYPRIKDKSDSFFRRQLFVPMKACFTGRERKYIKKDYLHRTEVLEYILYRVLNMNYYTLSEPESCKIAMQEFKEVNDPIRIFWSDVKDEVLNWNLLPFTFLYDLYKSWFSRNKPTGTLIGKTTFTNDLLSIIKLDPDWDCQDKTRQIAVTKSNMSGPESLIAEYGLTDWMSKTYKGSDWRKQCIPVLKQKYAGLERVNPVTPDDEDGEEGDAE